MIEIIQRCLRLKCKDMEELQKIKGEGAARSFKSGRIPSKPQKLNTARDEGATAELHIDVVYRAAIGYIYVAFSSKHVALVDMYSMLTGCLPSGNILRLCIGNSRGNRVVLA